MLIPVLLAGGVGTRLWPLSRESRPKQFLALNGESSLLEQTLARVSRLDDVGPALLIGNVEHRFVMAEQLRASAMPGRVLIEPARRDTAPAVAAAAFEALAEHGEDAELLVLPTDHAIADAVAFEQAIQRARARAARGGLTLFGVRPGRAEPGFGYIQAGETVDEGVRRVQTFVEKPDKARAAVYLEDPDYYWNSGMFLFRARDYLASLERQAPAIHAAARAAHAHAHIDIDFLRLEENAFEQSPAKSIDYAVMEGADDAVMVELDAGWTDLGSWSAVADAKGADAHGNSVQGDVVIEDSHGCIVHSQDRLVATIGLRDTIVIETGDAVLVADRGSEQQIRQLVARLIASGREEATAYRKAYRPWGSYEQIAVGERFQVKHIRVIPGGRLSLQKHHHRAEHWIVVHGTARITCDGRESLLTENESTFIPLGAVHRLENPGKVDLDLIEVQSGSYLGEDDIVRFDDVYGRSDSEPGAEDKVPGAPASQSTSTPDITKE
ncbi:mannose-1-phosphate guanylyltransferase [Salinisphaera shabanensis T35B1]|jgi:mannose-1-phosphate guanylyltransferase/mannose-6-phosphate isomerase|uniref:mannose-1-phosphate guanylyltransferase n=1 Tax=Salinisphaera shabanensis E1L3A TaxID=1033802 RepID=U2FWR7_9GAMM|nr:mannose-1-phosphate guanylyltransferase/mannose-6-phosphate isomerase [Salinisphaera shabanensis]ERJ20329.1 Xanthan biosynthesis protein XanB [Salinisphaera shabanensis E1L3A]